MRWWYILLYRCGSVIYFPEEKTEGDDHMDPPKACIDIMDIFATLVLRERDRGVVDISQKEQMYRNIYQSILSQERPVLSDDNEAAGKRDWHY